MPELRSPYKARIISTLFPIFLEPNSRPAFVNNRFSSDGGESFAVASADFDMDRDFSKSFGFMFDGENWREFGGNFDQFFNEEFSEELREKLENDHIVNLPKKD